MFVNLDDDVTHSEELEKEEMQNDEDEHSFDNSSEYIGGLFLKAESGGWKEDNL